MMKRTVRNISILSVILMMVFISVILSCQEDKPDEVFFEEDELQISAYLEQHTDEYSTLIEVLEITGLKNTLNAYGHYTFFAPDNDAFNEFCSSSGKSSVAEFETDYLITLVRYHLIDVEMESAYFRDGAIPDTTYSGDYLVITFSQGGLENIQVNDASITQRDILLENGVMHKIDKVLVPVVGSIYDRLEESGDYSIFSNALELSGLADTLKIIRIDLNEDIFIRTRFTIFAEPDEVYNQMGIQTAQDLVTKYSNTGDPTSKEDGFYQYMAYHITPGLFYLNEIDSFNYPTLAENKLINVKLRNEIYLNYHTELVEEQPVEKYVMIVEEESNKQAKNGVFHALDTIMEPYEPAAVYIVLNFTDYQGISLGQTYTEKDLEDIPGIYVENTGLYYRNSVLNDGETNLQTTSASTGWLVEFDLPSIQRGNYDLYLYWASYQDNCGWVQTFWDGSRFGDPFSMVHNKRWPGMEWLYNYNTSQWMGRILLTETSTHTIKFVSLDNGWGNFDYMVLQPVTD
jgi:uncharacterized surface protein with fasciclin (FAS1) repeats